MLVTLCFKGVGALLIVYAGGAIGWRKANAAVRRVHILTELCSFLNAVQRNLHYRCGRTEEILASAQKQIRPQVLPLYFTDLPAGRGLQTALDHALYRTEQEIERVTLREERAVFRTALEGLGGCPAQEEEQKLAHACAQLSDALEKARAEADGQRRLYRTLGLSLGGAAALLLL